MTSDLAIRDDDLYTLEVAMADRIPSGIFIIRAVPTASGKFNALYSAPGLIPELAMTRDGRPYLYDTEQEAEWGAAKSLIGVLNSPRVKARQHAGKPERYEKLTGPDFAMLLHRSGISPTFFAYLYGTSNKRVLSWIDGTEAVPHPARIILELFIAHEANIDAAEKVTDRVTTERRPQRKEVAS